VPSALNFTVDMGRTKLGLAAIQFSPNAARNVQTHSPFSSTPTRLRLLLHPSTTRTQPCPCIDRPYLHADPHSSPRARLIQHKTALYVYLRTRMSTPAGRTNTAEDALEPDSTSTSTSTGTHFL
jgi:hypothetical protein